MCIRDRYYTMNATRRQQPRRLVVKLYQFFHISSAFLYCALLVRWLVLLPLVSRKYLPGGIHRFLCCLMVYSAVGNILWWIKMRGLAWSIFNRHNLKNINLISVSYTHLDVYKRQDRNPKRKLYKYYLSPFFRCV